MSKERSAAITIGGKEYVEAVQLADALGYEIVWRKRK